MSDGGSRVRYGTDGGSRVRYGSATGRWVLLATILGSGMAFLDSTVVNVALPAIGEELGAGFSGLQWTLDAYLLSLAALLLLGGSLGDRYGRRWVFGGGLAWFTVASVLCGLAPSIELLVAARAVQGVGAALLVPGSLAIIAAVFEPSQRGRAIGTWAGLAGVTTVVGPLLGGFLVDVASWRFVFFLNVPLALLAAVAVRHVPETRNPEQARVDVAGAVSAAAGLGGVVFALIEAPVRGWSDLWVLVLGAAGVVALAAFVGIERRVREPMLPLGMFSSRQFTAANLVTLVVYAALGGASFLVVVHLQTALSYSALAAGAALAPITLLLLVGSPVAGTLVDRVGPRLPMTAGPVVAAAGLALLTRVDAGSTYVGAVLPGVAVFGLGLAATVAPLTTTVLSAIPQRLSGIASGVNNAFARVANLLAVALLPLAAGIAAGAGTDLTGFTAGFRRAMWLSAALCLAGAAISAVAIRNPGSPADAPGAGKERPSGTSPDGSGVARRSTRGCLQGPGAPRP